MNKLFRFITIAAVGVVIGTVAGRIVKTEKVKETRNLRPASNQKNQLKAVDENREENKDLDDLDNCFI
jgi:gas vesicle protein